MHFPAISKPTFQKLSPWNPNDSASSKRTQVLRWKPEYIYIYILYIYIYIYIQQPYLNVMSIMLFEYMCSKKKFL